MPIKITTLSSLPSVLNKWAKELETRMDRVEKDTDKANLGDFVVKQVTRKDTIKSSGSIFNLQSTLPILSGAFTYVSDDHSVTWSWTGLQLYYPNGETKTLPNGSNTVTGLSSSTTYYFYPYYSLQRNQLEWVPGGVGTPDQAFTARSITAAQQQGLDLNAPLSGGAVSAITAAPAGSGGGGGGGSGCLRSGQLISVQNSGFLPVEDVLIGDFIACPQGWTKVLNVQVNRQPELIRFWLSDGSVLETSPTHPVAVEGAEEGYKQAQELCLTDRVLSRENPLAVVGVQRVRQVSNFYLLSCDPYHEFYFGDSDVVTHNFIAGK